MDDTCDVCPFKDSLENLRKSECCENIFRYHLILCKIAECTTSSSSIYVTNMAFTLAQKRYLVR